MTVDISTLTRVEKSLYLTLAGRALDSRESRPVLGDRRSDEISHAIGFDPESTSLMRSKVFDVAVRTKRIDEQVQAFVHHHPDAIVLELGAGLDPRIVRVDPPETVDWYDIDLPGVIEIRSQMLSAGSAGHPRVHPFAADLDDPDWLADLPTDRPTIAVADGLVAFFSEEEFGRLLRRITAHFPHGEIVFNNYTRLAMKAIQRMKSFQDIAPVSKHPGFDGPHDPERWNPDLEFVEAHYATGAPELDRKSAAVRAINRLIRLSTKLSWQGTVVLRYRF